MLALVTVEHFFTMKFLVVLPTLVVVEYPPIYFTHKRHYLVVETENKRLEKIREITLTVMVASTEFRTPR